MVSHKPKINEEIVQTLDETSTGTGLEAATVKGDVVASLISLVFGALGLIILTPAFVFVPEKFAGTVNSPAFLPRLLFVILIFLSVLYLCQSIVTFKKYGGGANSKLYDWFLALGVAAVCTAYIIAVFFIGMTLASMLGIAALTYYFGERRPLIISTLSISIPILLWFFFEKIANVYLPKGVMFSSVISDPLMLTDFGDTSLLAIYV
ncbi:tripartite tricarboxylate transporter TctB family protein [Paracoccaceae bacterium]|nr:tripartite tricarboxylate transporter TctB family protein [Paracoccaceae bacterium]